MSRAWSQATGDSEESIEVVAGQHPARFTFRGGQRLPEPGATSRSSVELRAIEEIVRQQYLGHTGVAVRT